MHLVQMKARYSTTLEGLRYHESWHVMCCRAILSMPHKRVRAERTMNVVHLVFRRQFSNGKLGCR